MTPPEQHSSLAAMVTALAEVTAAQTQGRTWNQIAAQYGYPSGRQAKKDIHALRGHVTRQLRLAQNQNG